MFAACCSTTPPRLAGNFPLPLTREYLDTLMAEAIYFAYYFPAEDPKGWYNGNILTTRIKSPDLFWVDFTTKESKENEHINRSRSPSSPPRTTARRGTWSSRVGLLVI